MDTPVYQTVPECRSVHHDAARRRRPAPASASTLFHVDGGDRARIRNRVVQVVAKLQREFMFARGQL